MITFEDLEKANKSIRTTDIKGKEYAEVNQRIKAFRMLFPTGMIATDLISCENGICIIKATVGIMNEDGERQVLGTGIAYEKEGSTFINKTSYIENCETSAVGRALGMCGFGIDTSVASFEEVQTAIVNQDAEKSITAEQKKALNTMLKEDNISAEYICDLYGIEEVKDFTQKKYINLVNNWDKMKAKYHERKNS